MGNTPNSANKPGFYTPSVTPKTHSRLIQPITPSINETDEEITTRIMTSKSPDISDMETSDTTQYFRPTFNHDISCMLSEIASEIDGDYKTNTITIRNGNGNDNVNDNHPTLQMLDDISSVNTNSFTPIPISPDQNSKNKHKYAHVKLDFVKNENYVRKISEIFTYHKQLGCGASCRVLLVSDNRDQHTLYALKEMHISDQLNRLLFATEYRILNILAGHENIISYHSAYIDKNCYYLSTTYCSGGTMLDRIIKQGHFNEKQCSEFIKNVLVGINYMHSNHIVHRDIKCENLIFDKPGKDGIVKIIDFGNSEIIINPKEIDKILVGSLHYLPPEMLSSKIRIKEELYKGIAILMLIYTLFMLKIAI